MVIYSWLRRLTQYDLALLFDKFKTKLDLLGVFSD